jgi:hypothetical protein
MQFIKTSFRETDLAAVVGANLLIIAVFGLAAILDSYSPATYYRCVQEDEYLEWATFWAFALAGGLALYGVVALRRATGQLPWFFLGLAVFCWVVAMEEISWGQRLLGFRPPPYFLAENYQQELNFHNVLDKSLRTQGLLAVIVGYGLLLPLLGYRSPLKGLFDRLVIKAPPVSLMPSFLVMAIFYIVYPFSHTGEWVEMMLGLGFLWGVMIPLHRLLAAQNIPAKRVLKWFVGSGLLVLALTAATTALSQLSLSESRYVDVANREIAALKRDLIYGRPRIRCGLHMRLYNYVRQFEQGYLTRGKFAGLQADGLAPERARFFIDPWNSPYWISYDCESGSPLVLIYSLGPNRRRDTSRTDLGGDDVGVKIR